MSSRKWVALILIFSVLLGACQKKEKVGSQELLDRAKEDAAAKRIGDLMKSPEPTNQSGGAIGAPGASPTASAKPKEQKQVVEIALIGDNPYYNPGPSIQIPAGAIIRVINKDDKTRHFITPEGPYDTGPLEPGKSMDLAADFKGKFALQDEKVPFATGTLEVF